MALLHIHCDPTEASTPPPATPVAVHRPTPEDVQRAVNLGDLKRAHRLLTALEQNGESDGLVDAEDAVAIADASELEGATKLQLLTTVVQHGRKNAKRARALARAEELHEVASLVEAARPTQALATLDEFFADTTDDPDVNELRARAHETSAALCRSLGCAYIEAAAANASAASPERRQRADSARGAIDVALQFSEASDESPLARLRRLQAFRDNAGTIAKEVASDAALSSQAFARGAWAQAERGKTPLLGSTEDVAGELLGPLDEPSPTIASASVGSLRVYLNLDARKVCRGVYVVRSSSGSRALEADDDALRRVLSQALGRPSNIRTSSPTTTVSSWTDGSTRILGRWRSGVLMELRIGDATP